jgi:putative heme-binding domain-containing protein
MTAALLLLAAAPAAAPAAVSDLKLPPGFTARLYADNPVAPDIYTMTIDDDGRVLVAGPGYVRLLVPGSDDYADRAIDLIDGLKDGPMGLLVEGEYLYVVGDGGLKRYRGYNGKDKLKGPPELLLALKATGEHDAHAVRRGPDGWLYVLCGNNAGVRGELITGDRSPVKDPIAGALLRLSPDFKTVEVVADGYRNPYSFDFSLEGEPFTYDSDNERCVGLPWYEGCRFYHVVPGGNYGWRSPQLSQTWRKPPHFPDVVAPVCDTGRGSPTGVVCYRHTHFPAQYRGGFFLADWTFGRIYHVPLKVTGASYTGEHEVFAQSTGTSGFAPTALAVHPKTGELYVSIGGRGTRGGVYRITCDKGDSAPKPLTMVKRSLDFDRDAAKQWQADCRSDDAHKRRVALDLIARWWDRVEWGRRLAGALKPNLVHPDRLVRRAAGRLGKNWYVDLGPAAELQEKLTLALASVYEDRAWALQTALDALDPESSRNELLDALRIIQLANGDLTARDAVGTVWEGYTFARPVPRPQRAKPEGEKVRAALRRLIPVRGGAATMRVVRLELARTLAALGDIEARDAAAASLDHIQSDTAPTDDFHYLIAFTRMTRGGGLTSYSGRVAEVLFELQTKVRTRGVLVDRHWPMRFDQVLAEYPADKRFVAEHVLNHPEFGRPEHAALVKAMKIDPARAAEKFLRAAITSKEYNWTPEVVALLGFLSEGRGPQVARKLWERPGLDEAIIRVLAERADVTDRMKFVVGLKSLDPELVTISAQALSRIRPTGKAEVCLQAVKALRRFPAERVNAKVRTALVALLQETSGEKIGEDASAWASWLVKFDPALEKLLNASDGFDAALWQKRQAGIDWMKGDAERGRVAFTKATCAACHDGGRAVGPSLLGIAKRFGREDLLTAILQPSKDVSPRYRPTRIVTTDDKAYTGIIIYEATDGVILQTGADTTVRVAGADIASKKQVEVSLMPAGLIDKLTDTEIADLLAYLGTLGDPKPK